LHLLYDTDARRFDACKQTLDDLHSKLNKVMVGYCCVTSASLDFNLMPYNKLALLFFDRRHLVRHTLRVQRRNTAGLAAPVQSFILSFIRTEWIVHVVGKSAYSDFCSSAQRPRGG
jgi:hypothetical protein